MLLEKLKKYNVYLASQSPRRQKLLEQMNIDFLIASRVEVDEQYNFSLKREEIAMYLSEKKSDAYEFLLKDNRLLITADTIVWIDNRVLGKPADKVEASNMLKMLSGKRHSVITGITLRTVNKKHTFFASTDVWFRKLTHEEIEFYIENYKPFDKAGAYGIQEWIGLSAIEKIEGSYFNVVGLPTEKLYVELGKFLHI
jgi:septum formation protein